MSARIKTCRLGIEQRLGRVALLETIARAIDYEISKVEIARWRVESHGTFLFSAGPRRLSALIRERAGTASAAVKFSVHRVDDLARAEGDRLMSFSGTYTQAEPRRFLSLF
jgi:hypothetical protein